jgi:hypothetical protein
MNYEKQTDYLQVETESVMRYKAEGAGRQDEQDTYEAGTVTSPLEFLLFPLEVLVLLLLSHPAVAAPPPVKSVKSPGVNRQSPLQQQRCECLVVTSDLCCTERFSYTTCVSVRDNKISGNIIHGGKSAVHICCVWRPLSSAPPLCSPSPSPASRPRSRSRPCSSRSCPRPGSSWIRLVLVLVEGGPDLVLLEAEAVPAPVPVEAAVGLGAEADPAPVLADAVLVEAAVGLGRFGSYLLSLARPGSS